ncbi:MAG: hypothetical protein JO323_02095 [Acidobacteriia bacterium]|nr:hypothetical protein [Terriglobia bacterium]
MAVGFTLSLIFNLTPVAKADTIQTYGLAWSGAALGNGASATGVIVLDLSTLPNPSAAIGSGLSGTDYVDISSDITSLSINVTGSGAGDGTFTLADLAPDSSFGIKTYWNTKGNTLNMEGNILTQLQADAGDFNLFFAPPGPQGSSALQLTTNGLSGNPMAMTEFSPVVTPEPGTFSSVLLCLALFVGVKRLGGARSMTAPRGTRL